MISGLLFTPVIFVIVLAYGSNRIQHILSPIHSFIFEKNKQSQLISLLNLNPVNCCQFQREIPISGISCKTKVIVIDNLY